MDLNKTLLHIKEKGRKLDYYLILNLISDKCYDEELLKALLKYQNEDYGFGHGLEPDVQTPSSSVLACNIAIKVLDEIKSSKKNEIIKGLVRYFVSQFNKETNTFNFVSSDIDDHPKAIWWNGDVNKSFGFFNPTPEVTGFLFKNRQYLDGFDIESLVDFVVEKVVRDFPKVDKPHSLYSVIKFYESLDEKRQKKIQRIITDKSKDLICIRRDEWENYAPQPYKIINKRQHLLYAEYESVIKENMEFLLENATKDYVWMPEWSWGQYDEFYFESIRYQWMGFLTFERLKVLIEFGYLSKSVQVNI